MWIPNLFLGSGCPKIFCFVVLSIFAIKTFPHQLRFLSFLVLLIGSLSAHFRVKAFYCIFHFFFLCRIFNCLESDKMWKIYFLGSSENKFNSCGIESYFPRDEWLLFFKNLLIGDAIKLGFIFIKSLAPLQKLTNNPKIIPVRLLIGM